MASPIWQSRTTSAQATAASVAVTYPASLANTDIVIVVLYKENTNAVTVPDGTWTLKNSVSTTAVQHHLIYWKRCTGGETGTVTFSWTGSVYSGATAHRITGCVTSGDPIEDVNSNFSNTGVTVTPAVSLASTSTDSLLLWTGSNFAGGNSWTPPGTYTERSDVDIIGDATKDNTAGGATGSVTGTAAISGASTAHLISLISIAGTPPVVPTLRVVRSNVRYL